VGATVVPNDESNLLPLNYEEPRAITDRPPQSHFGNISFAVFGLLCAWFVWGIFQILGAFYAGPGIPGRWWKWWTVFVDVGGVTIATAGVGVGARGLLDRGKGLVTSVMGISGNAVGLVLFGRDLLRQL
jgi:hypothetical protein